jgi:hypothetical protein
MRGCHIVVSRKDSGQQGDARNAGVGKKRTEKKRRWDKPCVRKGSICKELGSDNSKPDPRGNTVKI